MGTTLIGCLFIQQTGTPSPFIGLTSSAIITWSATRIWMIHSQLDQSWIYLKEHAKLRTDYIMLVLHILVKNCEYFKKFANMVSGHIPDQFSKEMKKQSEVVS